MESPIIGSIIGYRYQVTFELGSGGFGDVVAARDTLKGTQVAIKCIKPGGEKSARREIAQLKKLGEHNPEDNFCLRLSQDFIFEGRIYMIFPLLGQSVREFMEMAAVDGRRIFTNEQVKHIAHQLLSAVKFVHDHDTVHVDLKTHNIVFVDSTYDIDGETGQLSIIRTDIKLIDFGLARSIEGQLQSGTCGTINYISPEMALRLPWSKPIDMWAVGCIIAELFIDRPLFSAPQRLVLLGMMEHIVGKLPDDMIFLSPLVLEFTFDGNVDLNNNVAGMIGRTCKPLQELFTGRNPEDTNLLLYQLVRKLLRYRPEERLTAHDALAEQFFVSPPEEKKLTKWFLRFKWW